MWMAASRPRSDVARLIVVMGVAGCGKSSVAEALAARMGATYLDGDSFHPKANIAKMSAGTPLTDDDRWPWLDRIAEEMRARKGDVVTACSALRHIYRDRLRIGADEPVFFAHLDGSRALIAKRMASRDGHFMPESLLDSQFATLERLEPDELGVTVDISGDLDAVTGAILAALPPKA